VTGAAVETMIPRRLDRLPWSRRHRLAVSLSYELPHLLRETVSRRLGLSAC
jgi:hypothetical protein